MCSPAAHQGVGQITGAAEPFSESRQPAKDSAEKVAREATPTRNGWRIRLSQRLIKKHRENPQV